MKIEFSIELKWPFTSKKDDEESLKYVPNEATLPGGKATEAYSGPLTHSGKPDKRYAQYWTITGETSPLKVVHGEAKRSRNSKPRYEHQENPNYFKVIELTHKGLTQKQVATELGIEMIQVQTLWNSYVRSSKATSGKYLGKNFELGGKVPPPELVNRKIGTYIYDEEFKINVVKQALDTSRVKICDLYGLPESTLRTWIEQYGESIKASNIDPTTKNKGGMDGN